MSPEDFFHALADTTRLRCLLLLVAHDELCVCDLTATLQLTQPKISRHLAYLRKYQVVSARRDGLWMHYRIHPSLPVWAQTVLKDAYEGFASTLPFSLDERHLINAKPTPVACTSNISTGSPT